MLSSAGVAPKIPLFLAATAVHPRKSPGDGTAPESANIRGTDPTSALDNSFRVKVNLLALGTSRATAARCSRDIAMIRSDSLIRSDVRSLDLCTDGSPPIERDRAAASSGIVAPSSPWVPALVTLGRSQRLFTLCASINEVRKNCSACGDRHMLPVQTVRIRKDAMTLAHCPVVLDFARRLDVDFGLVFASTSE